jgi:hypothetical protein
MSDVKFCKGCQTVKNLSDSFYKAGSSYQKLCKLCHNKKRCEYVHNGSKYIKKIKGFDKLDKELQNKIIYDIHIRINYKEIATKYGISYQTLLNWKKKGIPLYKIEEVKEIIN